MVASDQVITDADESLCEIAPIATSTKVALGRKNMATELIVRDEALAAEQSAVVNESMQLMNVLLDTVGMNARGRNVAAVAQASPPLGPLLQFDNASKRSHQQL